MGQSPTINIEVSTDFETALEVAKELVDQEGLTVVNSSIDSNNQSFEFELSWNDIQTGEDEHLQHLWIVWNEGRNEYYGSGTENKLLIHYSSYYYEDSLKRFTSKVNKMEKILQWLENNIDKPITHYVSTSTI